MWFFRKKKNLVKAVSKKKVNVNNFSIKGDIDVCLDTIYLRVCGILGISLPTLITNIEVCNVKDKFKELFNRTTTIESFYVKNTNTIYVNKGVTKYILGHEIAHAIINNYFVVHMPEKMQEILAGYVEYELRKGK